MRSVPLLLLAAATIVAPLQSQDLADVFAKVSPSVVTIRSLESRLSGEKAPHLESGIAIGSGVLIADDGTVLTAAHVVNLADEVTVEFLDGSRRAASVVASEGESDLALVRVRGDLPAGIKLCVLADSDKVKIGNEVFVVGAPLGMEHTLTAGHISAKRKEETYLGSMRHVEHFQTDAAINPGNSGGPLFDRGGDVIGIVCHIATSSVGSEGLGFAVTSNAVRAHLLDHPQVWLGFDAFPLLESLSSAVNVPDGQGGLLVLRVAKSSPAARAGLRAGTIPVKVAGHDILLGGDIVLQIQGHPLTTILEANEALNEVRKLTAGSIMRLSVLREGKQVELTAKVGG